VNCSKVLRNIQPSQWACKGRIPDSGASKNLAGLLFRKLEKLGNLALGFNLKDDARDK
jgi:hypothetical protein